MTISHENRHYSFRFENMTIHASNIIYEQFNRIIPTHAHGADCYEIHYISEGFGSLVANREQYRITPGTLYVTGPFVEHSQTPLSDNPMKEYCVYFRLSKTPVESRHAPMLYAFTSHTFWFGQDTQDIHTLMRTLFEEIRRQQTGYQQQIELLLSRLIILMIRNYEKNTHTPSIQPDDTTDESKTLIIEKAFLYEYQSLTLENLAEKLHLSPRQTQRLLQEYYGKTFQQKRTDAKMSVAAILLQNRETSITRISDILGYSSPEYFSSAFKAYYGTSPREYRKKGTDL